MQSFFADWKQKYYLIFHYFYDNIPYILLKSIAIVLFFIPFLLFQIVDLIVEIVMYIPNRVPILGFFTMLVCDIVGGLTELIFLLLNVPDLIYDAKYDEKYDEKEEYIEYIGK